MHDVTRPGHGVLYRGWTPARRALQRQKWEETDSRPAPRVRHSSSSGAACAPGRGAPSQTASSLWLRKPASKPAAQGEREMRERAPSRPRNLRGEGGRRSGPQQPRRKRVPSAVGLGLRRGCARRGRRPLLGGGQNGGGRGLIDSRSFWGKPLSEQGAKVGDAGFIFIKVAMCPDTDLVVLVTA